MDVRAIMAGISATLTWLSRLMSPRRNDNSASSVIVSVRSLETCSQSFVSALADLNGYQATHGPGGGALSDPQLLQIADLTDDDLVTNADIQGLINLLANGGGSGGGSLTAVPEPSSFL